LKQGNHGNPKREVLEMLAIKKEYVVTDDNKKKAVLIDIDTFNKMEEIIENYGLAKYMAEVKEEKALSLSEAKEYYSTLRPSS
jgi:PHD/YefM family antitoxin component YafN of YafNO toxin-antitoxin module